MPEFPSLPTVPSPFLPVVPSPPFSSKRRGLFAVPLAGAPRSRRRAFIAAPLLGTLIFLICLMLIVALNRSETSRVDEIVSQSYHNRLVSLVELFRSDLGANFNVGLQRTIEYGLTSQCWFNFAPISTEKNKAQYTPRSDVDKDGTSGTVPPLAPNDLDTLDGLFGLNDGKIDEQEQRYDTCMGMKSLVKQVVCPTTLGVQGLPTWVETFDRTVSFEGVVLDLANREVIPRFRGLTGGGNTCYSLVEPSSFDCKNFATNPAAPFKCCKKVDDFGECVDASNPPNGFGSDDYVPGACLNGDFLVPVSVRDLNVFPYLPRIEAKDSAGNVIRAGAIADEDFQAPVTYPLFKYLDAAFTFNRYLAYGPDTLKTPVASQPGVLRGVIPGACEGRGTAGVYGCTEDTVFTPRLSGPPLNYGSASTSILPRSMVPLSIDFDAAQKFYNGAVVTACNAINPPAASTYIETYFCPGAGATYSCATQVDYDGNGIDPHDPYVLRPSPPMKDCRVNSLTPQEAADHFSVSGTQCGSDASGTPFYCGDIDQMLSEIVFFDTNPSAQVDPLIPNTFCWLASSAYSP